MLGCIAVMLSCGARPQKSVSITPGMEPASEVEIDDSLRATFLYIDGLKALMTDSVPDRATEIFERVLELDSLHAPSMYQLAMLAVEQDSIARATELSRKALEVDSTDVWYRIAYGRTLLISGRLNEALPELKRITANAPTNPENYRLMAALYSELKMPFSAIEVLDSAEMRAGLYPELHLHKCALLASVGQLDRARTELERYRAGNPYDVQAGLMLASVYGYIHRDSLHAATLRDVLTIDPSNGEALMRLYDFYRREGNEQEFVQAAVEMMWSSDIGFDTKHEIVMELTSDAEFCKKHFAAITELTHALVTQYPDEYRAVELHAIFTMTTGNIHGGANRIKEYFRKHPDNASALELITNYEAVSDRFDSVRYYYCLHREALPESVEPLIMLSALEQHLGNNPEAHKFLKQALRVAADNDSLRSSVMGMQADMLYNEGKKAKAYKLYRRALDINPDNCSVLNNYAYFLSLDSADLVRAETMAARAVSIASTNATYLDTYAWVLFKRGETERALKVIKQAVSLDSSGSSELLLHYGDILYATGERFMARMYWRRALNAGHDPTEIEQRLKLP